MGGFYFSSYEVFWFLVALGTLILSVVFYLIFLVRATCRQINALDSRNNKKKAIALLLVVWIPACILVLILFIHGFVFLLFNAGSIIMGILASVFIHMSVTKPRRKTTIILIGLLLFLLFLLLLLLFLLFRFMPTVQEIIELFFDTNLWIYFITHLYLLVHLITFISPVTFDLIFLISDL